MVSPYSTRSTVSRMSPRWVSVDHQFFYKIFALIDKINSGVLVKNMVINNHKKLLQLQLSTRFTANTLMWWCFHALCFWKSEIHQHTSAYVIIRHHTSAYVNIRQHTSTYVSIRHTSTYVSIRHHTSSCTDAGPGSTTVRTRIWDFKLLDLKLLVYEGVERDIYSDKVLVNLYPSL